MMGTTKRGKIYWLRGKMGGWVIERLRNERTMERLGEWS
jgi:hypothetical protein